MTDFINSSFYNVKLYKVENDRTFNSIINGDYGSFYKDFLLNIDKESVFIDIGANFGIYSLVAAQNKKIKMSYAIEPVKSTIKILERNIKENKFERLIRVYPVAISHVSGDQEITIYEGHSGAATMRGGNFKVWNSHKPSLRKEKIKTRNYKFLNHYILHNLPIHIKIDVEGLELEVLSELFQTEWCNKIESIFLELDSRYSDVDSIIDLLTKNSFFEKFNNIDSEDSTITNEVHYDALYQKL